MPSISYDQFVPWANYHLTVGTKNPPDLEPRVEVEDSGRFHAADLGEVMTLDRFGKTAESLWSHVLHVRKQLATKEAFKELGDPPRPFPAALVGRGWSFSNLIGANKGKKRESMLICDGLAGSVMIADADRHPSSTLPRGRVAMTQGGTRFRELADWAARSPRNLSLKTSGTHLGATVAGAVATATHGSRLGFGGVQDMVVGMHLITGPDDSVWIERASVPVLSDAAARQLHPAAKTRVRIIRNDDMFEDALVHLGCMGIVNCVAIELVPDTTYNVFKREMRVDKKWLALVAKGRWREIAALLGHDDEPVFYELTLNPHGWDGPSALHTMYFLNDTPPFVEWDGEPRLTVGDAIAALGSTFSVSASASHNKALLNKLPEIEPQESVEFNKPKPRPRKADMRVFDPRSTAESAYDYYRIAGKFGPNSTLSKPASWRQIHSDEITFGNPGSLYNTSYAVERRNIAKAIPAICAAIAWLPMSFVFTIRFVSNPSGTMAFTRFSENAVIEIDGLSPWICNRTRHALCKDSPTYWHDRKMLDYLEFTLPNGAERLKDALNSVKVSFSNHFGKCSFLSSAKIHNDFGKLSNPASRLSRWRATRLKLLASNTGRAIFWNWGAINFGLIEQPKVMPDPLPQAI